VLCFLDHRITELAKLCYNEACWSLNYSSFALIFFYLSLPSDFGTFLMGVFLKLNFLQGFNVSDCIDFAIIVPSIHLM